MADMTREEAIEMLKSMKYEDDENCLENQALDIAIKAVEQESCEDCISRKEVNKIINKWLSHSDYELKDGIYDMTNKIHKLPSVTPKAMWIPVSERLPEDDGKYLVTNRSNFIEILKFAKDLHKVDKDDFPESKSGWYTYDSEYGYYEDDEVLAWIELSEPYRAESEE